jgi:C4-dicarboxylate transporter DctM subunit
VSLTLIGIIGIIVLVCVFISGMPVALAMASVGFFGVWLLVSFDAGLNFLVRDFWETFSSYPLSVVPMFILMGTIAFHSGISTRLYSTANAFLGHLRGGLAMATIGGCALFAAMCGSTTASVGAMGQVTMPAMKGFKYDPALASGAVAAGGTLGILIPPSTAFIIYGILTSESIGKLFIAGILPGIVLTLLFILTIYVQCLINPKLGPSGPKVNWANRIKSLSGSIDMLLLFVLVMGGIFIGFFTPTEAGSVGACGAIALSIIRRKLSWEAFLLSVTETVTLTSMIFTLLAGAFIFGRFIAFTRISFSMTEWLISSTMSPTLIVCLILLGYCIGGCFLDSLPLVTLTVPIVYPAIINLGFDPIWFGVVLVLTGEMGIITPPMGMNVFVLKGVVPDLPIETIFKGTTPFVLALVVGIIILIVFPRIATFLPQIMMN